MPRATGPGQNAAMKRLRVLAMSLAAVLALTLAGCAVEQPTGPGTPAPIGQTPLPVDPSPGQFGDQPPAAP
jgi:trimethylamine:corrinoid methyltransferase-like protein